MKIKPDPALKEISVLYVEDEEMIRDVFSTLIKRYVKELYTAGDGGEGLEKFLDRKPDIVISDIRMPVLNGLEMADRIKQLSPETPIIFITAFSDTDYLRKALEIGVEGYITKPIDRNLLLKKLNFLGKSIVNKRKIDKYHRLIGMILDENDIPIMLLEDNRILISNKAFNRLFGYVSTIEEFKRRILKDSECDDFSKSRQKQILCIERDGVEYVFETTAKAIDTYVLVYFKDITEYRKEILIDELTGVFNRKYLKILERKILGKNVCLSMCDIDNFKSINDTYGHIVGDRVLRKVASILRGNLRSSDVVIRYGGEEFLIFLDGVSDVNIAGSVVENLRVKIERDVFAEGAKVSCSFGVGCGYISNPKDLRTLIEKVDGALYEAKRKGKNRVERVG